MATGSASDESPATGHGLLGMQERVALYGGQLRAGHRPEGGYQVYAQLPLHYAAPTNVHDLPVSASRPIAPRRRRSLLVDVAVSAFWFTAMAVEASTSHERRGSVALNVSVVAAMALSALWRRRFPAAFLVIVGALAAVLSSGITSQQHASLSGLYVALLAPYTAGAWGRRPRSEAALGFWLIGAVVIAIATHTPAADLFGASLFAVVAWATGRALQAERELSAALRETGRRLDAESEERARLAVVDERTRIARELHAMVARHVTVMVVQAEGAQKLMNGSLSDAIDAMRAIEETGREALAQMRRLLGVLRNDHNENDETRRQPQSGLAEIRALRDVYA
jgi:signal transduction histidine kinase